MRADVYLVAEQVHGTARDREPRQSQFHVFYNRIDAAVVITTRPVALVVLLGQKRIVSGLTAGAVK